MATTVLVVKQCSVKFAASSGALATAPDFTCQVQSLVIEASPVMSDVAPTFCGPGSQAAGNSTWSMTLTWLQDWDATAPGGLSDYTFDNDGKRVFYEINPTDPALKGMTGECWIVAGAWLGPAGEGLTATQTFPCVAKPTKTATLLAAEESETAAA